MPRQVNNPYQTTDWSDSILEIDNQFGLFNAKGLFETKGIASETITFEKDTINTTLIPTTNRRGGKPSTGNDRKSELFTLRTAYFLHTDAVGVQDIQGYTKSGADDRAKLLGDAVADKLEDMKMAADQTIEYMKISAIKGVTRDAYGVEIVDMFNEFGISDTVRGNELSTGGYSLDFLLGTGTTDIYGKISELRRYIAKNAMVGASIGRIEVPCSVEFFDGLVNHPTVSDSYADFRNEGTNGVYKRENTMGVFEKWGVFETFTYNGVMFYAYPAEFTIDDGDGTFTTVPAFGSGAANSNTRKEGFTVVTGVKGAYRGVYAPQNTLEGANVLGQEMYVTQYADPRGRSLDFELEMSPLFWLAKPQLSIRCHSSD
jgi:hypothetical protein